MAKRDNSCFDISQSDPITLRDALQALSATNQDTVLLNYGNVIIRKGYQDLNTVRLLSGGLAGADLTHAICVGRGMLTAAIIGENGTPSSRQILHIIKELNQGCNCGVLVIVQQNTDLFNFGLAVQRASLDCRLRVKLVVMNDDKSLHKERYSCGFILLTKILGAMAEDGAFFTDICHFCDDIIHNIATVHLHYADEVSDYKTTISIPTNFEKLVKEVIGSKSEYNLTLHPSVPVVALINTAKGLDRFTELGLVKKVIEKFNQLGIALVRIYYGSFVTVPITSATLTILKVSDNKLIDYLDAKCDASGWHQFTQYLPEIKLTEEIAGILRHQGKEIVPVKGPKLNEFQDNVLIKSLQFACDALISCERQLNVIDEEKSSGNVGTRLKKMAEHVNKRLSKKKLPTKYPYTFLKKLGIIAEGTIGGTMGSIYGIFFGTAAEVFENLPETEDLTPILWVKALSQAVEILSTYFPQDYQSFTMFYPMKCCELAIIEEMEKSQNVLQCFNCGVSMAEQKAQETKSPNCKQPDAGAHAVGIWMRAVLEGVKLMGAYD